MILIYYAHSKNTDNLKVVKFETFKFIVHKFGNFKGLLPHVNVHDI
jgi:hypothetical protein